MAALPYPLLTAANSKAFTESARPPQQPLRFVPHKYADMTLVKNFLVPIPSLEEQKNLVEYLDYNTKGIDLAIVQQKRLIDLLRERKNIIINEIVTGKVKVI